MTSLTSSEQGNFVEDAIQNQLLEKMSVLSEKLDSATELFSELSKKVKENMDSNTPEIKIINAVSKPPAENESNNEPATNGNTALQTLTRNLGYINWQVDSDLHKQRLVKVDTIRAAVAKLRSEPNGINFGQGKSSLKSMTGISSSTVKANTKSKSTAYNYNMEDDYEDGYYDSSSNVTLVNVKTLGKETRFPLDAVYVDVNIPHVKSEIDFLKEVNVRPTNGVIQRFLTIIEKEMHTTRTFEEKYGLIWQ